MNKDKLADMLTYSDSFGIHLLGIKRKTQPDKIIT